MYYISTLYITHTHTLYTIWYEYNLYVVKYMNMTLLLDPDWWFYTRIHSHTVHAYIHPNIHTSKRVHVRTSHTHTHTDTRTHTNKYISIANRLPLHHYHMSLQGLHIHSYTILYCIFTQAVYALLYVKRDSNVSSRKKLNPNWEQIILSMWHTVCMQLCINVWVNPFELVFPTWTFQLRKFEEI